MVPLREEKVQPILCFLDIDRILMSVVLENQLFQIEECSFMRDLLPHLHRTRDEVSKKPQVSPDQKLLTLAMYCGCMTSRSRGIAECEQHIQLQKLAGQ